MIVCEYCFKDFHARGSDAYLTAWATKVDQMAVEGWEVVEYVPRSLLGQWTVLFSKSSERRSLPQNMSDFPQDAGT